MKKAELAEAIEHLRGFVAALDSKVSEHQKALNVCQAEVATQVKVISEMKGLEPLRNLGNLCSMVTHMVALLSVAEKISQSLMVIAQNTNIERKPSDMTPLLEKLGPLHHLSRLPRASKLPAVSVPANGQKHSRKSRKRKP